MKRQSYTVDPHRAAQARLAVGLTQAEAADDLGVNRVTLNKIENGKANASLDLIERMAARYTRSREWLLGQDHADPVLVNRDRIARALGKIAEGFEELGLVEVLNGQAHLAAVDAVTTDEVAAP